MPDFKMGLKDTPATVSFWSQVLSEAAKMNLQKDPDTQCGPEGTLENPV